tara:strand:- start:48233 stop:49012 length:780 start_codon:yes stop_codon:yes gene_type:complete
MAIGNLFSRLGFSVEKPQVEVTIPDAVVKANRAMDEKRKTVWERDSRDTAQMYHDMLPTDFIKLLQEHNDYMCVQWGGRKVARLCNLSRNILDLEIITEDRPLEEKDRAPVLKLLVLMSWLVPIPVKRHFTQKDVESEYRPLMKSWLCEEYSLVNEAEADLILAGVFENINVGENPVLNIFHDALRIEEAQFGNIVTEDFMRTYLGKVTIFRGSSQRNSKANLTPHWLIYLQELKSISGLVDPEQAKKDEEYNEKDAIG